MAPTPLIFGFMQLVDAAVPIVAHELGFASRAGLALKLVRDTSWANIRDKLSIGQFDGAHCLAPLVLAHHSLQPMLPARLCVPYMLNRGGGTITVSAELYQRLLEHGPCDDPLGSAQAFGKVVRTGQQAGTRRVTLAMVFPFASHHYALRHWLHAAGLSPEKHVDLIVLPPQLMVEAMQQHHIDGFCAGAPWPDIAAQKVGAKLLCPITTALSPVPEKALAVQAQLRADRPDVVTALVGALDAAAAWCADTANRSALANMLARPHYLDVNVDAILSALTRMAFHGREINRPDPGIARWYAAHMLAAGQLRPGFSLAQLRQPFDPSFYDAICGEGDVSLFEKPLFDGFRFEAENPDALVGHLRQTGI
jgi:two-component system, oxyanion-binding sensor